MYDQWLTDPVAFIKYCKTLSGWNDPNLCIDRENNDKGYFPGNLRFANMHIQTTNQRKSKNNTSGYTGVNYLKIIGKWQSSITIRKKRMYIERNLL